jgi:hypothetical protein
MPKLMTIAVNINAWGSGSAADDDNVVAFSEMIGTCARVNPAAVKINKFVA